MLQTEQQHARPANPYLESFGRFERTAGNGGPSWLYPLRKAAMNRFAQLGFPGINDEDWRYTNVTPIAKLPFRPQWEYSLENVTRNDLLKTAFGKIDAYHLVFVNGHFSGELSARPAPEHGIQIRSLAGALAENIPALEKHLAQYADDDRNSFASLNTAFFQDGAFIHVPAKTTLDQPVHLVFVSSGETGSNSQVRNLILMERASRATILETYIGLSEKDYFTNAVTEIAMADDAALEHCKFQDENPRAYHIATIHAQLGRNARFTAHSIATGSRLSRNNIKTVLDGEGIECVLNGLYLTKDQQLADHHMIVEHVKPHCNSHEYFNGILENRSRGVFHGRIFVHPEAQKTDAKQTNKNLLLSDHATIDTKPQLEIYADDVKCTHGATVGQLNDESIFYLRARGIGADTARRMLIHAFAGEIIDRVQCRPAREALDKLVWDRLEENPYIAEVH